MFIKVYIRCIRIVSPCLLQQLTCKLFHTATNLAYAKHFGNLDTASSANFESLNAQGFKLSYVLENGEQGETFIQFATPLTKREEIRPVLEGMAREAEEALGWVNSLILSSQ